MKMTLNFSLFGSTKCNNGSKAYCTNVNVKNNAYKEDENDDEELVRKLNMAYYYSSTSSSSSSLEKQSLHCSLMTRFLGRSQKRSSSKLNKESKKTRAHAQSKKDGPRNTSGGTPSLVLVEEQVGNRGPVAIPVSSGHDSSSPVMSKLRTGKSEAQAQTDEVELKIHRLLEERLGVLEGLTGTLQNWQKEERHEYEKCMSELATQVSRAVALQQNMKTEVEKLQQRVIELETHNKAMTTMIVPTLMKLHSTIGRDSTNPGAKSVTSTGCREPERSALSLERKENQKRSVNSPKQRKTDCRIPRINSNRLSRVNHTKQATELQKSKVELVKPNKSSKTTFPSSIREDEILGEVSLSSPTSSKSESSSSALDSYTKSKGVRSSSSSYSGIPRISLPRPLQQGRNSGTEFSCKEAGFGVKNRKDESDAFKHNNNGGGSRLPVRKNLSTSILSPFDKGDGIRSNDNGERSTPSLTFVRKTPSKLNSNNLVKRVGNCVISPAAAPKAGKDEGYSTMSSEALAVQENVEKCQGQNRNFLMHKSNTFNAFLPSDNYRRNNEHQTRSPKRINFTSLPNGAGQKVILAGPRNTVRIIRGVTSYDIELDGAETTEDPSTSTILWEDSDDSDILFLPLEMTSEASSSRSTLVPSYSSFISPSGLPNSRNSFLATTRTTNERSSMNPLRRSRGEDLVALLAAHRSRGGEVDQDEIEERALIEKWMRLEDVRNEVPWDDAWAWDWDGVARTHKLSRVIPPAIESDESEFWFSSKSPKRKTLENRSCSSVAKMTIAPIQIDSSTWTKSRKKKHLLCEDEEQLRSSLDGDLELNSPESQLEKVLDGYGNNGLENEKGLLINAENCTGVPAFEIVDGSPPIIEFTPEFYHLVNYGSNLSFSDIDHSPADGKSGVETSSKIELWSAKWISGRMDDKVSQTDFSSSLENLSVSSELFTECRNCLELIKKLVRNEGDENSNTSSRGESETLDRHIIHEREELKTDLGSPTTWVSVPKGLPTSEVDQKLEILSSSESEDVMLLAM